MQLWRLGRSSWLADRNLLAMCSHGAWMELHALCVPSRVPTPSQGASLVPHLTLVTSQRTPSATHRGLGLQPVPHLTLVTSQRTPSTTTPGAGAAACAPSNPDHLPKDPQHHPPGAGAAACAPSNPGHLPEDPQHHHTGGWGCSLCVREADMQQVTAQPRGRLG